jgi:hypothetical protein
VCSLNINVGYKSVCLCEKYEYDARCVLVKLSASTNQLFVTYRGLSNFSVCADNWTTAFSNAVCQQIQQTYAIPTADFTFRYYLFHISLQKSFLELVKLVNDDFHQPAQRRYWQCRDLNFYISSRGYFSQYIVN